MATTTTKYAWMEKFLQEIEPEKRASDAEGGEGSSHPTEKADDSTVSPSDGGFAAEVAKKVKELHGNTNVESAPEKSPQTGAGDQGSAVAQSDLLGITAGTPSDPGGTGPNRDAAPRPPDSGTSSPASADAGEKYSAERHRAMDDRGAVELWADRANQLLAVLATPKAAAEAPAPATPAAEAPVADSDEALQKAARDGYELAQGLAAVSTEDVAEFYAATVKEAVHMADLVAARLKSAEGGPPLPEEDPAADPAAPDPAGAGGPPSEDMGGAPGGEPGGIDPAAVEQLMMAMQEAGITPEQLMELLTQAGPPAGPEAGMPPEAGAGAPMPPPEAMSGPPKMAREDVQLGKRAAVAAHRLLESGNYRYRPARMLDAKQAQLRQHMHQFLADVVKAAG